MKHVKWLIIVFICAVTTVNLSCSRNVFDQEKYQEIIDSLSPVDTIDPNHNWILHASKVLIVNVPDIENVEKIQVLTANPREKGDAEIVGETFASAGERVTMSISYPKIVTTLYVAAVDEEGYYTITPFTPATTSIVNFDEVISDHEKISYEPQPQEFTYCFEEEYPQPGDYDYNDVVVRIAQKRTGEKEMRFDVQLAAAHQVEMVPERLFEVGAAAQLRHLGLHQLDDGAGTLVALLLRGQADGVFHHLLHLTAILGHDEFLALSVVV